MFALSATAGPSRIAASVRHVPLEAMRSFSQSPRSTAENPSSRPQPARTYRAAATPRSTPRPAAASAPTTTPPPTPNSSSGSTRASPAKPSPPKRQAPLAPIPVHRSTLQAASSPAESSIDKSYSDWPWYQVHSSSPDFVTEERVVFARPSEMFGDPKRIRFVWMLGGVTALFIIVVPMAGEFDLPDLPVVEVPDDAPDAEAMRESRARNQETIEQNRQLAAKILDKRYWIKGVLALGIIAGTVTVTKMHSNNITRLTQIRQTPKSGGQAIHRIRYRTSLVDADLPFYKELREARLDECRVRIISRNNQLLAMSIGGSPDKYRLDFTELRESDEESDKEMVLSLVRLERLFGELVIPEERTSKFGNWVASWTSKKKA